MNWVYVSAVVAAAIASMHYVRSLGEIVTQGPSWLGQVTISFAGISAVGLFFVLLFAGMLVGPWWWPLIALIVAITANTFVEESQLASLTPVWILPLTAASAGLTTFLAYANASAP